MEKNVRRSALRHWFASESAGGMVLMVAALLALFVANSIAAPAYFNFLKMYVGGLSVQHWINDGLMAIFFLLVGLEIKRELLDGQLETWSRRVLPGIAALGGMIVPAIIYVYFNYSKPDLLRGWAIPTATDIAFALGVLALLGSRVPVSLKIFLTALAILDDLGAVVIIAIFYTAHISVAWLAASLAIFAVLFLANLRGVRRLSIYGTLGALLWITVLKSGVHATVAGVILAFTIPLQKSPAKPDDLNSPLHMLEHRLNPWVTFGILPLFGFANAGVSFSGLSLQAFFAPVPLGIAAGLFVGKQLGVFLATWAVVKSGWSSRPAEANWVQIYALACLCGIGFTMSLFVGLLAFPDSAQMQDELKLGVLLGSLLSAAVGATIFLISGGKAALKIELRR